MQWQFCSLFDGWRMLIAKLSVRMQLAIGGSRFACIAKLMHVWHGSAAN
jgi:hypothetical protein